MLAAGAGLGLGTEGETVLQAHQPVWTLPGEEAESSTSQPDSLCSLLQVRMAFCKLAEVGWAIWLFVWVILVKTVRRVCREEMEQPRDLPGLMAGQEEGTRRPLAHSWCFGLGA